MTTMTEIFVISILKSLTVVLGIVIVYLAAKSYRASRKRPIFLLTVAMALLTLGAISEGILFQGLRWTIEQSRLVEAVITLVAFAILVYSLYV
ncbi:MAG: hypothetical protein WDA16_09970 [Candidatus Thermoplasmatota archaeon]